MRVDANLNASTIELERTLAIRGLRFRHFAGEADFAGMVAVHQSANLADGTEDISSVERMASNYAHLTNSDPYRDVTIAEVDGRIVAYARVYWSELTDGGRGYAVFGFVEQQWRRRGLGGALLRRNEGLQRETASEHPGVEPKWLESFSAETNAGNLALLTGAGYGPVRFSYDMVRPTLDEVPDAPTPDGIEIRSVEREHYRRIWEASNEAFRDEWGQHDESEEAWANFADDPTNADPSLWRVAWDGDEVAGLVITIIPVEANEHYGRARAWLGSVAVRRPWRRRGLARSLMAQSLRAARDAGFTSAGLGVDTENPSGALRLYEALGFGAARRYTTFRKRL